MEDLVALDLSGARLAHAAWRQRLRSYLDGQAVQVRDQMVSHHECDLGRWYHREGLHYYGHIPEMHELDEPHRALHELIGTLVEHQEQGRSSAAELCYAQVKAISERIVGLLHVIEEKAAQPVAEQALLSKSIVSEENHALQGA